VQRIPLAAVAAVAAAAAAFACGGSGSSSPSTPSPSACSAPATSTTITIANGTVCPPNITVPRGTQVTFVNQDTAAHEMSSDPHPEHTDCVEINQAGHLEPGQSRQTGNLNTVRRCGFHDHLRNENANLRGSITIQ
jgi:plastocyanin